MNPKITTLILALMAPTFLQGCSPNLIPYYYRGDGDFDKPDRFSIPLSLQATGGQVAIYSLL